jgi:hypothetical protein
MDKIFTTPYAPISWGELIDKITILEIKQANINSLAAVININKELGCLSDIIENNTGVAGLIKDLRRLLLEVNKELWKVGDDIRDKEQKKEFDSSFVALARSVYILNDERAKIKKLINQALKSELV